MFFYQDCVCSPNKNHAHGEQFALMLCIENSAFAMTQLEMLWTMQPLIVYVQSAFYKKGCV